MKRVKVTVTARDIKNGVRCFGNSCPIARACRRAGLKQPNVDGGIYYSVRGNRYCHRLSEKAKDFIDAFDGREEVKPFKFTLRLRTK